MCKACLVTSKLQDLEEKKSWSTCCNMELMCMLKMMVGSVYYYSFHFHTIYHLAIPISTTLFFFFFYLESLLGNHRHIFKGVLLVCQIWLYTKMA